MSFNLISFLLPKHSMRLQDVHRIALICYGGLGDVLLFTPVIQEIRRWVADVHISLYVEERSAGVASVLDGVDVVLSMPVGKGSKFDFFKFLVKDLKFRHFDVVLSTGRNPFIAVALAFSGIPFRVGYASKAWASALLSRAVEANTQVYAADMHYELAHQFLRSFCYARYQKSQAVLRPSAKAPDAKSLALGESLKIEGIASHRKHILIHPGVSLMSQSKGIYKGWSAFQWATFILNLTKDHAVYLIGGKDDAVIIDEIMAQVPEGLGHFRNLVGQTQSFSDLAGVMSVMDVVCAVDSAPMHLAIALNRPTLAFFGPTNDAILVPSADSSFAPVKVVARQDLACRPCLWHHRQNNCESSDCLSVPVESMLTAVYDLIEEAYPPSS